MAQYLLDTYLDVCIYTCCLLFSKPLGISFIFEENMYHAAAEEEAGASFIIRINYILFPLGLGSLSKWTLGFQFHHHYETQRF